MRKLRPREIKWLVGGHSASKCWSSDSVEPRLLWLQSSFSYLQLSMSSSRERHFPWAEAKPTTRECLWNLLCGPLFDQVDCSELGELRLAHLRQHSIALGNRRWKRVSQVFPMPFWAFFEKWKHVLPVFPLELTSFTSSSPAHSGVSLHVWICVLGAAGMSRTESSLFLRIWKTCGSRCFSQRK